MKKYEYRGEIYCEKDLSEQIDNYGGDLFDFYWQLKEDGECEESTFYIWGCETSFDSYEEMIEKCCDIYEVE